MKVIYDNKADALYIQFTDKKSTKTTEVSDDINVDYSGKSVVGIEILDASKKMKKMKSKRLSQLHYNLVFFFITSPFLIY